MGTSPTPRQDQRLLLLLLLLLRAGAAECGLRLRGRAVARADTGSQDRDLVGPTTAVVS
jgi:hypothetical protein